MLNVVILNVSMLNVVVLEEETPRGLNVDENLFPLYISRQLIYSITNNQKVVM
jgi:hypothetical protein